MIKGFEEDKIKSAFFQTLIQNGFNIMYQINNQTDRKKQNMFQITTTLILYIHIKHTKNLHPFPPPLH